MKYMLINFVPETALHFLQSKHNENRMHEKEKYLELLNITRMNTLDYASIISFDGPNSMKQMKIMKSLKTKNLNKNPCSKISYHSKTFISHTRTVGCIKS